MLYLNVDISIETLSNLFEIYTHLLALPNISSHVLCILLDSLSSLLNLKLADSDCEHITPLLSDFLECLFSVQCKRYHHYDEESALASVLTFYNSLSASPCWFRLSNDLIWSVLYSLYSLYSQVFALSEFDSRKNTRRCCGRRPVKRWRVCCWG